MSGFKRVNETEKKSKKSEAFLNLDVKDKHGQVHKVPGVFIPMNSDDNNIFRSLIAAAKANPDFEIALRGTVGFAKVDDGADDLFDFSETETK